MRITSSLLVAFATVASTTVVSACDICSHSPSAAGSSVEMVRRVKRMQPDATGYNGVGPTRELEWGELNFLHTTDTHGWLEGHVKQPLYSGDWGDWNGFVKSMRFKADLLGVDLLLVDTGDLHDGAGLSDATALLPGGVNGQLSDPLFAKMPYDVLSIGNHELYVAGISNLTYQGLAKTYGDSYLTSNVDIKTGNGNETVPIGKRYRYFRTKHGINILAFGVLYDFKGYNNMTVVTPASQMVNQSWFQQVVAKPPGPVDLFLIIGHNPVRGASSTFGPVYSSIRKQYPTTPIQLFGGHTHIRDFIAYDERATGLEAGQYCETVGWLAMTGIKNKTGFSLPSFNDLLPTPKPTRFALNSTTNSTSANSTSLPRYARRYLDWNRASFTYHAKIIDSFQSKAITDEITADRKKLNLTKLYGCAPQTYCQSCAPPFSNASIYPLMQKAMAAVVVNPDRANKSRMILTNSGSIRYDLYQGPFTYDDSFIVSPFQNTWNYIADVPYAAAATVEATLNAGPHLRRRKVEFSEEPMLTPRSLAQQSACPLDGPSPLLSRDIAWGSDIHARSELESLMPKIIRRQAITPGYTTSDDFGTDGDDIAHSRVPYYTPPNVVVANASFPSTGVPSTVDYVFASFTQSAIISALNNAGANVSASQVGLYVPANLTTNTYLPLYAQSEWSQSGC